MRNKVISDICVFLEHMEEEELEKIKEIIKELCSFPYSEMFIEVHNGKIINKDFTKKTRYTLKKKENKNDQKDGK